jgi:hypothetical protein
MSDFILKKLLSYLLKQTNINNHCHIPKDKKPVVDRMFGVGTLVVAISNTIPLICIEWIF